MILADTSIWIDHLGAAGEPRLAQLLNNEYVLMHPFVIGEIALGTMSKRDMVLGDLALLPQAARASDDEVLHLLHAEKLFGKGIGYVDLHLLASTRLTPGASLWTKDKRLKAVAMSLKLAVEPPLYH